MCACMIVHVSVRGLHSFLNIRRNHCFFPDAIYFVQTQLTVIAKISREFWSDAVNEDKKHKQSVLNGQVANDQYDW